MENLRFRLMHEEALKRLQDAEILEDARLLRELSDFPLLDSSSSDSAYLLRLLGFELLLKLIYEFVLGKEAENKHSYEKFFGELPQELQDRLLSLAGASVGPTKLASEHMTVLQELGKNFVGLRYPWVRYANLTEADYSRISAEWYSKGMLDEEATFRFHPDELTGLLAALVKVANEIKFL